MGSNKENRKEMNDDKEPKEGISFEHDKDGIKITINIYNTNNLANEGGNAGVKQTASEGSQNLQEKMGKTQVKVVPRPHTICVIVEY